MKVRDILEKLQDASPDALVCVAELGEAFAANIARVEQVDTGRSHSRFADGREAVELDNGNEPVVVIRW